MKKVAVFVAALFFVLPLFAGDKIVNVQGKLTDNSGTPLIGNQTVTFRLYDVSTAAVSSAVWVDTMTVSLSTGMFNVALGTHTSLDTLAFDKTYYLGLQVSGDANEMSPRQPLAAAPYAFSSLGNFGAIKDIYVTGKMGVGTTTPSSKLQTRTGTDQNIGIEGPVGLGSGATLNAFNDAHSANIPLEIRASTTVIGLLGNVGIGTTAPAAKFHVTGNVSNEVARFQPATDMNNSRGYISLYTTNPSYWWELSNQDSAGGGSLNGLAFRERSGGGNSIERLYIATGGNVGIGTTAPAAKFHVIGNISNEVARFQPATDINGSRSYVSFYTTNPGYWWELSNQDPSGGGLLNGLAFRERSGSGNSIERFYIATGGKVGIGTTTPGQMLDIVGGNGRVQAAYSWLTNSDIRLKTNVTPLLDSLQKVLRLRGVRYDLKESPRVVPGQGRIIGFVAQELEKEFPELVVPDEKGLKGVAYDKMTAILVEAFKEQEKEIQKLRAEVEELKAKNK